MSNLTTVCLFKSIPCRAEYKLLFKTWHIVMIHRFCSNMWVLPSLRWCYIFRPQTWITTYRTNARASCSFLKFLDVHKTISWRREEQMHLVSARSNRNLFVSLFWVWIPLRGLGKTNDILNTDSDAVYMQTNSFLHIISLFKTDRITNVQIHTLVNLLGCHLCNKNRFPFFFWLGLLSPPPHLALPMHKRAHLTLQRIWRKKKSNLWLLLRVTIWKRQSSFLACCLQKSDIVLMWF